MKTTEKTTTANVRTLRAGHTCPPGHCCECNGCGGSWIEHHKGRYLGHVIVLILGVAAAFYIGMKLGEFKGYFMSGDSYGMSMHDTYYGYGGMMSPGRWGYSTAVSQPTTLPAPATTTPSSSTSSTR